MAFGESSFRSRAASLLRFTTSSTTQSLDQGTNQEKESGISSNTPTESPLKEKAIAQEGRSCLEQSHKIFSSGKVYHSSGSNAVASDRAAQRIVRTIPSESSDGLSLPRSNNLL